MRCVGKRQLDCFLTSVKGSKRLTETCQKQKAHKSLCNQSKQQSGGSVCGRKAWVTFGTTVDFKTAADSVVTVS